MSTAEEEHTEDSSPTPDDSPKWRKGAKMVLPHVGLYLFLFIYLLVGAWIFQNLEFEADKKLQKAKIARIKEVYKEISDEIHSMASSEAAWEKGKEGLFKELSRLSTFHENRAFTIDSTLHSSDALQPRWTKSGSLLYALSILTTTGYSYAVPVTPWGQYTAIAYGLLGIPMMVLAAVDIGRFLSHIVLEAYSKYKSLSIWEKISSSVLIENSLAILQHPGRKYTPTKTDDDMPGIRIDEPQSEEEEEEKPPEEPSKRLPLSINASILLVFCMMGGLMYIAAGGKATFIEAFFVTFNLVANLTMSEMPNDLNHVLTLIYIFVFVTFGVAVLSMCAELAAFELKEIFLKIHYFGRKINFKRRQKKEQMEVEVKELLKIIEEIRRRYPEKEHITSYDILQFMHEQQHGPNQNNERRDTIAFMPQTMEILRFADEQDMEERSTSRMEEIPLFNGNIRMVDILQFTDDDDVEKRVYQEMRKYTREYKASLRVYSHT